MSQLKFEFTADQLIKDGRVKRNDIDLLKEFIKNEDLPRATEEQIGLFLISCENDLQRTQQTIVSHFKIKHQGESMTNNRNMLSKELTEQTKIVETCVIPHRTKDNYLVIFQRLKNYSYWNFNLDTCVKYMFMTLDLGLMKSPPDGVIALFDMRGVGLMHLTKLRVGPLRVLFNYLQDGLPCQIRGIHVLNSVHFIDKLLAILKPFMKKELFDMLHFHQPELDMKDFFENCLEAECVPSDYGGKQPSVEELDKMCVEKLKQMNEWFQVEEAMRKNYKPKK